MIIHSSGSVAHIGTTSTGVIDSSSYMSEIAQTLENEWGLTCSPIYHNLSKLELFRAARQFDVGRIRRDGGYQEHKAYATQLGEAGPLVFLTDPDCTGRPVDDTYAVAWPEVEADIWWKSSFKKYDPEQYTQLLKRVVVHLNQRNGHLFVQDVTANHDADYSIRYRVISQYATHAYFTQNMFLPARGAVTDDGRATSWTMLNVQTFRCNPERDGCRSNRVAVLDFRNRICLVAGPADYCGLLKKSIFTVMNFLLPKQNVLSMHCSATINKTSGTSILFGLSGTGKTTLSADASRQLIGDDEIGWSDSGVSNLENGCYAKLIDLDRQAEPIIAAALVKPGTLIENVPAPPGQTYDNLHPENLDLFDRSITENTRLSYPLDCNPNVADGAQGGPPSTIVLLTADAFGVLPPISVLDEDDVMYHFVQGFTARIAGTEVGLKSPEATFSSCFGAPFMSLKPIVYAKLLQEKMRTTAARCVLLNTGWTGGSAATAPRISLSVTRALLNAAMEGVLHRPDSGIQFEIHPQLGLRYPTSCPGVDAGILNPVDNWGDRSAYESAAAHLRKLFQQNYEDNGFHNDGIPNVL